MARIAGVDLPRDKKVEIGLTYIFGIGRTTAQKILGTSGVKPEQRVREIANAQRRIDARLLQDLHRGVPANAVNVRQTDLDLLVAREIDTRNTSHISPDAAYA